MYGTKGNRKWWPWSCTRSEETARCCFSLLAGEEGSKQKTPGQISGQQVWAGVEHISSLYNTASEKASSLQCLRHTVMRSVNVYVHGQSVEKKRTSPQASFPPFISVDLRAKHFELWSHYWDLITFPKCSAEHLLVHCKVLQYSHNLGSQLQEN